MKSFYIIKPTNSNDPEKVEFYYDSFNFWDFLSSPVSLFVERLWLKSLNVILLYMILFLLLHKAIISLRALLLIHFGLSAIISYSLSDWIVHKKVSSGKYEYLGVVVAREKEEAQLRFFDNKESKERF